MPELKYFSYTYAYGAVCPFDGESCFLILPLMNKKCTKLFLEEISSRFQDNFLMIVCDGASAHKIEENDLPSNIMMVILPPYSPELNPEENIWDDMREKFFYNFAFKSMDALEDKLIDACRFYENNPQTVQSISSWNWILNC